MLTIYLLFYLGTSLAISIAGINRPRLFLELYKRAGGLDRNPSGAKRDFVWAKDHVGNLIDHMDGHRMNITVPSDHLSEMVIDGYNSLHGAYAAEEIVRKITREYG